jgi:hypothetical protein
MAMSAKQFMQKIVAYYGKYQPPAKGDIVGQYVAKTYSEADLDLLFREVLLEVSSQYKTPPDVAMLELIRRKWNKENYLDERIGRRQVKQIPESTEEVQDYREQIVDMFRKLEEKYKKND